MWCQRLRILGLIFIPYVSYTPYINYYNYIPYTDKEVGDVEEEEGDAE